MNYIYMLKTDWSFRTWSSFIWSIMIGVVMIVLVQMATTYNRQQYQKSNNVPMYMVENKALRHVIHSKL